MKARLSIFTGLAVSAALLYFAVKDMETASLPNIISEADLLVAVPIFFVYMLELTFRSLRWKLLLSPSGKVSFADSFKLESAALALSNILPLRLGEVVRGTYGASLLGIPAATVFCTMLVERAMDAAMLTLMFIAAAALGGAPGGLRVGAWIWLLPAGLAAALAALAFADRIGAHPALQRLKARFAGASEAMGRLAMGARALRSPRAAALAMLLAALQWAMDALNLYLLARAFGIAGDITPLRSLTLLFTGAMAVSVPGVPGYFGNFEFAITKAAGSWGVPKETAFAYAAFGHVLSYAIFTGVGLIFVYKMGQSLGKVWEIFGRKAAGPAGQPAA
jgi:hypothetical protein